MKSVWAILAVAKGADRGTSEAARPLHKVGLDRPRESLRVRGPTHRR